MGIRVWTHPEASKHTKEAARFLVDALVKEGFEASEKAQNPINNPKHEIISLVVGTKR